MPSCSCPHARALILMPSCSCPHDMPLCSYSHNHVLMLMPSCPHALMLISTRSCPCAHALMHSGTECSTGCSTSCAAKPHPFPSIPGLHWHQQPTADRQAFLRHHRQHPPQQKQPAQGRGAGAGACLPASASGPPPCHPPGWSATATPHPALLPRLPSPIQ